MPTARTNQTQPRLSGMVSSNVVCWKIPRLVPSFFKIEDAPLVHLFGPRSRGPIHVESQVARPKSYLIGSTNRASWPNKWRLAVMFSR